MANKFLFLISSSFYNWNGVPTRSKWPLLPTALNKKILIIIGNGECGYCLWKIVDIQVDNFRRTFYGPLLSGRGCTPRSKKRSRNNVFYDDELMNWWWELRTWDDISVVCACTVRLLNRSSWRCSAKTMFSETRSGRRRYPLIVGFHCHLATRSPVRLEGQGRGGEGGHPPRLGPETDGKPIQRRCWAVGRPALTSQPVPSQDWVALLYAVTSEGLLDNTTTEKECALLSNCDISVNEVKMRSAFSTCISFHLQSIHQC